MFVADEFEQQEANLMHTFEWRLRMNEEELCFCLHIVAQKSHRDLQPV